MLGVGVASRRELLICLHRRGEEIAAGRPFLQMLGITVSVRR
jgi:hypothetical protein